MIAPAREVTGRRWGWGGAGLRGVAMRPQRSSPHLSTVPGLSPRQLVIGRGRPPTGITRDEGTPPPQSHSRGPEGLPCGSQWPCHGRGRKWAWAELAGWCPGSWNVSTIVLFPCLHVKGDSPRNDTIFPQAKDIP